MRNQNDLWPRKLPIPNSTLVSPIMIVGPEEVRSSPMNWLMFTVAEKMRGSRKLKNQGVNPGMGMANQRKKAGKRVVLAIFLPKR